MCSLWASIYPKPSRKEPAILWQEGMPACQKDALAEGKDENRRGVSGQPTGKPADLAGEESRVLETVQEWTSRVCDAQSAVTSAAG